MSLLEIEENIIFTQNEIEKIKSQTFELQNQARLKTNIILFGILLVIMSYISLLVYGIYVYFTWDIMEPIVYFIEYSVLILLSGSFFITRKKFSIDLVRSFLNNYFLRRAAFKRGIALDRIPFLEKRLNHLKLYHGNKLFNNDF